VRAPTPSKVFDTYWLLAFRRMEIFHGRIENPNADTWTDDPILRAHKFTNAYRAADRVSQYLIRKVIYRGGGAAAQDPDDVFFRTLLFKFFNKIETWELIERELGPVTWSGFDGDACDKLLSAAMQRGMKIFSAAYIMPAGPEGPRKHTGYLALLKRMMVERLPAKTRAAGSLAKVYEALRAYPLMGEFLAFQYAIDLNYGPTLDFDEDEFVVAGPGALSGLKKCFSGTAGLSQADLIRWVTAKQEAEFDRLGLCFRNLWGRRLHLVDCQNLFCETNKYARIAHPETVGTDGRKSIKQIFAPRRAEPIDYWFPPKWGLNKAICSAHGPEGRPKTQFALF
jgi:alpha-glutamyl/putrescinyl thymine pyrophosphorylase clade 1